ATAHSGRQSSVRSLATEGTGIPAPEVMRPAVVLLVVAAIAQASGDPVGGGADGGHDGACLVAPRRGDRVELGRELLIVDGEARREDLVELLAQSFLAGDRVGSAFGQLHRGD